jgi:hypothetical protein
VMKDYPGGRPVLTSQSGLRLSTHGSLGVILPEVSEEPLPVRVVLSYVLIFGFRTTDTSQNTCVCPHHKVRPSLKSGDTGHNSGPLRNR